MGKQIAIRLSQKKEREFIDFLKSTEDIEFISLWSKTRKLNQIKNPEGFFYIWNKKFKFKPYFTQVDKKSPYYRKGHDYALITSGKPLIQYSNGTKKYPGRIYWEKYFTAKNIVYDIEKFERWYNSIVGWVKKNCKHEKGVYVG